MSIGLVCHFLDEEQKYPVEKSLLFGKFNEGKYSNDYIIELYKNNILSLLWTLENKVSKEFKSYRISSNLFPLNELMIEYLQENQFIKNVLLKIGDFAQKNKIRLTSHPDQFVVLSSNDEKIKSNSLKILKHHAWIFDQMGLEESAWNCINVHGGKKNCSDILIKNILSLPKNIRNRLTLENDESSYNIHDLYQIYFETKVPLVFDSHHYHFNDGGLTIEESFYTANSTWNKIKPLQHLSNTEPELINGKFQDRRKHSENFYYIPKIQLNYLLEDLIDIDFEFKGKNLAIKQFRNQYNIF